MLIKILGILDIFSAIALYFSPYIPNSIRMTLALILFCKGMIFGMSYGSWTSMVDAFTGVYIGLTVYGFNIWIITLILSIQLSIKGLMSLFARG